jgi:hypothetical protein
MAEYIDRDAVYELMDEAAKKYDAYDNCQGKTILGIMEAQDLLYEAPAADVVPRELLTASEAARADLGQRLAAAVQKLDKYKAEIAADVAPVNRGRWIRRRNETICSRCRFIYYASRAEFNFCPNCGADMRGK